MDKELTAREEKVFELLESKDWKQLTEEERSFVAKELTQEQYCAQRKVILSAKELDDQVEPLPLVLPASRKAIVIPLYQAIAGVAAAFIIAFFLFNGDSELNEESGEILLADVDTVYVDRVVHEVDTVLEYRTRYIEVESSTRPGNLSLASEPGINVAVPEIPSLNAIDLSNKGEAASSDNAIILVGDVFQ